MFKTTREKELRSVLPYLSIPCSWNCSALRCRGPPVQKLWAVDFCKGTLSVCCCAPRDLSDRRRAQQLQWDTTGKWCGCTAWCNSYVRSRQEATAHWQTAGRLDRTDRSGAVIGPSISPLVVNHGWFEKAWARMGTCGSVILLRSSRNSGACCDIFLPRRFVAVGLRKSCPTTSHPDRGVLGAEIDSEELLRSTLKWNGLQKSPVWNLGCINPFTILFYACTMTYFLRLYTGQMCHSV